MYNQENFHAGTDLVRRNQAQAKDIAHFALACFLITLPLPATGYVTVLSRGALNEWSTKR